MKRKIRLGMVGGGQGAFIGAVHRMAARLDDRYELVCGAFSSTPEKSKASAEDLMVAPDRAYGSWQEMIEAEKNLPADKRMDVVAIVTPNHVHCGPAIAALTAGFHVICDKPMTTNIEEAKQLAATVKESGKLFCLTHNYTGYPMVKEARDLVQNGTLGKIRRVVVEYPQGWMATFLESEGQKQADWRTDPNRSGSSFTMGDIGTHCFNLAETITGQKITEICSELNTFVSGRKLDDDGSALIHFSGGAKGILWASGIAVGEENGLNIRIYGEKGGLKWRQEEPNTLIVTWLDKPTEIRRTNTGFVGAASAKASRIPCGHPEGFIEAFANLYTNFADAVCDYIAGNKNATGDYPKVEDGVRGMAFIKAVVESSKNGCVWTKIEG